MRAKRSIALASTLLAFGLAACAAAEPQKAAEHKQDTARPLAVLLESASRLTTEEMGALARHFQSPAYFVTNAPDYFQVVDGAAIGLGAWLGKGLDAGDLQEGVWLVTEPIVLADREGYTNVLERDSLLVVGEEAVSSELDDSLESGGGVTCDEGTYACCGKNINGVWHGKCIPDGDNPDPNDTDGPTSCIFGGPGATACTTPPNRFSIARF